MSHFEPGLSPENEKYLQSLEARLANGDQSYWLRCLGSYIYRGLQVMAPEVRVHQIAADRFETNTAYKYPDTTPDE